MLYIQLAWRYASRRLVNLIAVLALALALAVQIVVMAVLDGMLVDLERRLGNLGEQVTLTLHGNIPTRQEFASLARRLESDIPGVKAVTPMLQRVGFVEGSSGAGYVWVQGIDLAAELRESSLASHLLSYKPELAAPSWQAGEQGEEALPGLFMGEQLADSLGLAAGMEVELFYADRNAEGEFQTRSRRFRLTSLFRSGVFERDRYGVYVPLEEAADFYLADTYPDAGERVEMFVLWLEDPYQANVLEPVAASLIEKSLPEGGVSSDTWQKRWAELASGMRYENNLMELVLLLNDLASGFCVFAILATLVSRRIRDVGLLRCIGMSRLGVLRIFLLVGLVIGLAGGLLGTLSGAFLAGPLFFEESGNDWRLAGGGAVATPPHPWERLSDRRPRLDRYYQTLSGEPLYPPRMFGVSGEAGLPVVIYPWKLGLYFLAVLVVSSLAALYPALSAAWREPVTALREVS
ncbi:MAG: FtsX-like permease family protein [Planctomycetota bacterium]|jgi:lipoprotein-releasing system permease protein|nr:FtsX-like permease family protein [Planctomycetota bacterium]